MSCNSNSSETNRRSRSHSHSNLSGQVAPFSVVKANCARSAAIFHSLLSYLKRIDVSIHLLQEVWCYNNRLPIIPGYTLIPPKSTSPPTTPLASIYVSSFFFRFFSLVPLNIPRSDLVGISISSRSSDASPICTILSAYIRADNNNSNKPRMVVHAQSVRKKWKIAGLLVMDIKGAFPTANADILQAVIKDQGTADNIVRWVGSFMSDCTIDIEMNGELGTPLYYRSGLPQGSPASPVLFNVLMSDLGRFV